MSTTKQIEREQSRVHQRNAAILAARKSATAKAQHTPGPKAETPCGVSRLSNKPI